MMSTLFDSETFKIITIFSISPGSKFNRKEIQEKTRMNNVPLDKALARLLSSGMLTKEKGFYAVNFESEQAKQLLAMAGKQYKGFRELPLDVYFALLDFAYYVSPVKKVEAYLFGSYAKLVYKADSDIDIAIIGTGKTDKKQFSEVAGKLEKSYGKKVETHFFERSMFEKSRKDPLVKEILRNGIKLVG